MKKIYLFLLLILGLYSILFLSSCSTNNNLFHQLDEVEKSSEDLTNDPLKGEYNVVREFDIETFNFGYSKDILNVQFGHKVRIKLTSSNGFHNFVIDELSVKSQIVTVGEEIYVEFLATKIGKFNFYSSYGDDKVKGMIGTIYIG